MFCDAECHDIEELWSSYCSSAPSYITALHQDVVMMNTKEEEWNNILYVHNDDVVLRDLLMTDAAITERSRPKIKSEHSYSLLISSPSPSPTTSEGNPHTPHSSSSTEMEDYFPVTSMNAASSPGKSPPTSTSASTVILKRKIVVNEDSQDCLEIKDEPISEPSSPYTPCQSSCDTVDDKSMITMVPPQNLRYVTTRLLHTSDSEEEDEDCYTPTKIEDCASVEEEKERIFHATRQELPPTPPSSANSDNEGTVSSSCSPDRRDSQISTNVQNLKGLLTPSRVYITHNTRQPIHTPLISCQPKGSTGMLILTEEEKRTLITEGYPVPTKLPLSKQEEKSLKKIRRKIKNKISAQESRRKKKEYMDNLERQVNMLTTENISFKHKLSTLEDINRKLLKEVQHLQTLLHQQQRT